MPNWLRSVVDVLLETYISWRDDRTIRLGAGLAYYALFTVVPLLSLTAALAGEIFGAADVDQWLSERLAGLGVSDTDEAASQIAATIDAASIGTSLGIFGVVSLLFTSSLLFVALNDAVKVIWDAPYRAGMKWTIRRRLMSFLMVLVTGGVIIAEFAVTAITGAAEALIPGQIPLVEDLAQLVNGVASVAALGVALVLLIRFLAPVRVSWQVAVLTAAATAAVLVASVQVVGFYFREVGGSSVSGAFGSLLVALTWVYVAAQIVLAGVQLSKTLTIRQQRVSDRSPG